MKRIISFLVLVAALAGNAWADVEEVELVFDLQVIEYAADQNPEEAGTDSGDGKTVYRYRQTALWRYFTGPDAENLSFDRQETANDNSFIWTVTTTGDIKIATDHYATHDIARQNCILDDGWVYFTGTSGTLRVTATQKDGSYSCSYTISYHQYSKKWNFYGSRLAVGTSSNGPLQVDLTSENPHWTLYQTGTTGEEVYYYKNKIDDGSNNPIDISGTNVFGYDCFPETAGLKFYAPMNSTNSHGTFGFYNESTETGAAENRFIALGVGAEVVIPATYYSGLTHPRIRIKMGRYGASTHCTSGGIELEITNGDDANGTQILGDYGIGGSMWRGPWGDYHQRGEYHFQPHDKNNDFIIKVIDGQYLKLYTIEVYESAELLTENAVLGDNYMLLNRDDNAGSHASNNENGVTGTYYLHYYGKGERAVVVTNNNTGSDPDLMPTGKITCSSGGFVANSNQTRFTYTSKYGEFGTFQIRLDCKTLYGNYVTDKATRAQSVGYLKPQQYPYTWDFTDVVEYERATGGRMERDLENNEYSRGEAHYISYPQRYNYRYHWELKGGDNWWDGTYGLRISPDFSGHNVCFCAGSQLWYGTTMIPELEGLGFTPKGKTSNLNSTLQILKKSSNGSNTVSPGIQIRNDGYSDYTFYLTVPSVPSTGAVYARVHPIDGATQYARYSYGDGTKDTYSSFGTANASAVQIPTSDGDVIYVIKGDGSNSDVNLYFNGVIVRKIAVSTDKKTFNPKGWTTESRDHDIDPSLTAEMNGRGIKTIAVTSVDYTTKRAVMTDVSNEGLIRSASDGGIDAYILRNTENAALDIVNGGFYLFVPDMHDKQDTTVPEGESITNWNQKIYSTTMESSIMKAQVRPTNPSGEGGANVPLIPAGSGENTNFAFTYQYYDLNDNGYATGNVKEGPQCFYRIAKGGASSVGNQGYLPLPTARIGASNWNPVSSRFTIMFTDDDESDLEATGVETAVGNAQIVNSGYYNMNGQKLNGKPSRGGLYILNGKKCVLK